ncbi:hypothetical protein [Gimesia aquarii]|uniref:hypothetical protein n=1 Tax=Gimesia aquarii TaxID=2527964 RepID=UPI001E4B6462|nr:hypothetical protein [Gimesia aquarii]
MEPLVEDDPLVEEELLPEVEADPEVELLTEPEPLPEPDELPDAELLEEDPLPEPLLFVNKAATEGWSMLACAIAALSEVTALSIAVVAVCFELSIWVVVSVAIVSKPAS